MIIAKQSRFPSSDDEIRFATYGNYLTAISTDIKNNYGNCENFCAAAAAEAKKHKPLAEYEADYIRRFLKLSWNTEYIACSNNNETTEEIRINNQWKPIQVYYAVYTAGEALSYVIDGNKTDSHKKCLAKVSTFLSKHGLTPYNVGFSGNKGRNGKSHKPYNFPPEITMPHNLQKNGTSPIEMVAKCLSVEHKHRIDEEFNKRAGKYKCDYDPGHTSLLHFLYRLRKKANYKDADIFLADAPDLEIQEFDKNLSMICFCTLLLFENFIIRKIGIDSFEKLKNEYLAKNNKHERLDKRFSIYKGLYK